ncbi:MAG: phage portal protein, partial [Cetobacterium sp.]
LFVKAVAKQVGSAIELPYEVLLSTFEKSYSASRAALLEAWKMFRARRTWMARDFCQPIYEMFLTEAVASGRINAPGFFLDKRIKDAYCKAEWYGPSQGQLDPLKEVMASAKKVEYGFSTYSRETAELTGMNWDHNCARREVENRKIKEGGLDNAT